MTDIKIDDAMAEALNKLTIDHFFLDQLFMVTTDDNDVELKVINIKELDEKFHGPNTSRLPFSVLLRSNPDIFLHQGMYRFNLDGIGELAIFIVPLGPDEKGHIHEMIFN